MTGSDVTRDGVRGQRPGREASPKALQPAGRRRRGRRRGEELMVPRAEFDSYYGRPVIKPPSWSATDIAGYFFFGGLAGAGSVLAAGAQATGRPTLARAMKISSIGALSLSTAALIHDLGRPARFHHMLRVFKPTSPMSVGSWLLAGYGSFAGAAAASAVTGRLPRAGAAATAGAALFGPAVAAYTAVLAADTAVPAWHGAHRELPYVFVASATAAASGMALAVAPTAENTPARYAAALAAVGDVASMSLAERRLGMVAETYRTGRAGTLLRAARALTVGGAACAALLGHRRRAAAAGGGAMLLAGSACTRFGIFAAGVASAEDPVYTVAPQREALERRAREREAAAGS
ncbi:NrfD/PsrC family molybdoenzyme membrane anchor subunit [Streptomyces sp. 8L]|uniref:NrfD/PsrC family molybdoenzyme membrane anchor subunit n=1 Tax=Streptomyces sp. 8L TaxID=2877242 RepID=UPI001CD2F19A|nr:NrfD/PsrC family molybdoenzyme membrane anchor subunit [Streptomyces sp. 8L]MCA1222865.1 polysulfide reductase NrfD [Streptomyces sp. 8L]